MIDAQPGERFGTWLAKRLIIAVVIFVAWSWFVARPASVSSVLDRTATAWCDVFPCPDGEPTIEDSIRHTGDTAVDIVLDLHDIVDGTNGPTQEEGQ